MRKARSTSPVFTRVVVTCEHASNAIPRDLAPLFRRAGTALNSHRGWDPGAPPLARAIAGDLRAPLHMGRWSRLVVDLNRSPHRPAVFSEFTRALDPLRRAVLIDRLHAPHWLAVEQQVAAWIDGGETVLHLGVHSFTPVLRGVRRRADFALLYDPRRPLERGFCDEWLAELARLQPSLRLRRNHPYRGVSDGLTTALRRRFPPNRYAGVEIEVNQALLGRARALPRPITRAVVASLLHVLHA